MNWNSTLLRWCFLPSSWFALRVTSGLGMGPLSNRSDTINIDWVAPLWSLISAFECLSCLHPLAIIPRKRLDISFWELSHAVWLSLRSIVSGAPSESIREECVQDLSRQWSDAHQGLQRKASADVEQVAPFLSVRTAFDLYLKALRLPRGSYVLSSALTIPDMVTLFEEHGLVLVPVDLNPDTLAPEPGALESEARRLSAETSQGMGASKKLRAVYIAHVFGAQVDMKPVVEVAARFNLLLWEDCAQIFTGLQGYLGDPASDAVFFSFGTIKRATAFGGGVARIGDRAILSAMLREEAEYPAQSPVRYLQRVLKCSLLLACTTPLLFGVLVHVCGLLGVDHDKLIMKLSHGFPKNGLLKAIRHRPSVPLLQMLSWRIPRYTPEDVEIRLGRCNRMLRILDRALDLAHQQRRDCPREFRIDYPERGLQVLPGTLAHKHTLWLFPVMVKGVDGEDADCVVENLLRAGFDATRATTSLMPVNRCTISPVASELAKCSAMMDSLVYLPLLNNIPESEWDRMGLVLASVLSRNPGVCIRDGARVDKPVQKLQGFDTFLRFLSTGALRPDVLLLSFAWMMFVVPMLLLRWML